MKNFRIEVSESSVIEIETDGAGNANLVSSGLKEEELDDAEADQRIAFNHAMDGIESLLVALAAHGMNLEDPKVVQSVKDAYDGCGIAFS